MLRRSLLAAPVLLAACLAPLGQPAAQTPLTVFAAASLTDALKALAEAWVAKGNPAPRLSFAASSTLARQIEQGAAADLFFSADEAWMDYLAKRGLIEPATRVSPIGNALVLVTPADRRRSVELGRSTDMRALLGDGRLAVADPAHVPAGRYAEEALKWMGQWDAVLPRLARADNVRAALLLVERGEAPFGIVYATDAAASRGVALAGTFPAESHKAITYPLAVTKAGSGNAGARAFAAFLTGDDAEAAWKRYGFTLAR